MLKTILNIILVVTLFISSDTYSQDITFSEHISPIIYTNCTSCHRDGEIGDFLHLNNYSQVYNYRDWIAYAIAGEDNRHGNPIMPPWPPDREYSTLLNERYLTDEQIQLFLDWVDIGAAQGNPEQEFPIPDFPDDSMIGEPDISFEMEEPYVIEGNFQDDYRCFVFPMLNDEDIEISAIEFRADNKVAVHHSIITYVPHGSADFLEDEDPEYGYDCYGGFGLNTTTDLIGGYTPGISVAEYPDGIARTIPANSDLIIQMHYAPLNTEESDQSSINIFLKDEPVDREVQQFIFADWGFFLPPDQETTITNTLDVPADISLINFLPHCHLLGKSWEIYVTTPTSDIIPIIKINDWDFDWQSFYYPEYLLPIPAGSVITATCVYDNTVDNEDNPNDPPDWVFPGQSTNDEMFFIPFDFVNYMEGDENIYLGHDVCHMIGDINLDGNVNILDVVNMIDAILNSTELECSDLNDDNGLNILDVVALVNIIIS